MAISGARAVRPLRVKASPDGDAVRKRILDAAQELFAAHGYSGTTTREIAERAGIGKRMLFYYFATKDAMYRAVLERVVSGLVAIHQRVQLDPGPIGLAEAVEGIVHFAALNRAAITLCLREIMDDGPHLADLVRVHLRPLFAAGSQEVARNMQAGVFREADPMHVLLNVGGLTLFYFLNVPLLKLVWDRDPLSPQTVAERAAVVRDFMLDGLAGPAARKGEPS